MKINDVRRAAYAMPLTNPAFPRGPYRFFDREYLIVTYRTDEDALRAVVPEPLEVVAQSARNFVCRSSLATLTRLVIGLVVRLAALGLRVLLRRLSNMMASPLYSRAASMTGMPELT
jgi:Acetoacetate decarboxylase (ADC)